MRWFKGALGTQEGGGARCTRGGSDVHSRGGCREHLELRRSRTQRRRHEDLRENRHERHQAGPAGKPGGWEIRWVDAGLFQKQQAARSQAGFVFLEKLRAADSHSVSRHLSRLNYYFPKEAGKIKGNDQRSPRSTGS